MQNHTSGCYINLTMSITSRTPYLLKVPHFGFTADSASNKASTSSAIFSLNSKSSNLGTVAAVLWFRFILSKERAGEPFTFSAAAHFYSRLLNRSFGENSTPGSIDLWPMTETNCDGRGLLDWPIVLGCSWRQRCPSHLC